MANEPTWAQKARMEHLQRDPPRVNRQDLRCPDCGAPLQLRVGRYGRFYGCTNFSVNGCKGSVTARDDGTPAGIPAKARIRVLRHQVMKQLEGKDYGGPFGGEPDPTLDPEWPETPVGQWGEPECITALRLLGVEPKIPPRTRWERMLGDCGFDYDDPDLL
jgi:ssDNA-binding Zn-finger/Zn-ribbon topoisomerase 1